MINQFKSFLLNESKHYLGQKAGDLLTAIQNLADDASNMGSRSLIHACQGIVNQIRRVLHGRWDEEDVKYLKILQKIGVALMAGIDDNNDLQQILASAVSEMEKMLNDLQMPINSLGTEEQPTGTEEVPSEPVEKGTEWNF
jgi:hypothetical protein